MTKNEKKFFAGFIIMLGLSFLLLGFSTAKENKEIKRVELEKIVMTKEIKEAKEKQKEQEELKKKETQMEYLKEKREAEKKEKEKKIAEEKKKEEVRLEEERIAQEKENQRLESEELERQELARIEEEVIYEEEVAYEEAVEEEVVQPKTSNGGAISFDSTAYAVGEVTTPNTYTRDGTDVANTIYSPEGYRIIAVDPNVIPMGSLVEVHLQNGEVFVAKASDTGGAIQGNIIDILVGSIAEADNYGRQTISITILN